MWVTFSLTSAHRSLYFQALSRALHPRSPPCGRHHPQVCPGKCAPGRLLSPGAPSALPPPPTAVLPWPASLPSPPADCFTEGAALHTPCEAADVVTGPDAQQMQPTNMPPGCTKTWEGRCQEHRRSSCAARGEGTKDN